MTKITGEFHPPFVDMEYSDEAPIAGLGVACALGNIAAQKAILLGIPGSGKTTLARELRALDPAVDYISVGQISRELDADSPQRKELDRLFSLAQPLGSPDFFLELIEPRIDQAMKEGRGYLLDGIPKKESEVKPLLTFLSEKEAEPDLLISCEISPLVAYNRTALRAARPGDPDTTEVFLNRTKVYLRHLDIFKQELSGHGERPVIILNTEKHSAEAGAKSILHIVGTSESAKEFLDAPKKLYESLQENDDKKALGIIGKHFDDTLPEADHGFLMSPDITTEEKQAYIEMCLLLKDPGLNETPYFLSRMAANYASSTLGSLKHIHESLKEEVRLRYGEDYQEEDVAEVYSQQYELKEYIKGLQDMLVDKQNLQFLTDREIARNLPELKHIEKILRARAAEYGYEADAISIFELMNLQPQLWGQLTSNHILVAPDLNYRRLSNGVPDSHHSLLPYTQNKRALHATSMGEYVPFIEAVSATDNQYSSTFGFIHFIGQDTTGEAYGVEYPIMMHDRRLIALNNDIINQVLKLTDTFYGNHDLWHNLLPVFSEKFILHHPDAPISFGGRLPAYVSFGNDLRSEKEEYEIGVAMAHARTQQERFVADPIYREKQSSLLLDALSKLQELPNELSDTCSADEISSIIEYLACTIATKAYNVFPDGDPIYDSLRTGLMALGVKPMHLTAPEVADLLLMQGLLDGNALEALLPNSTYPTLESKRQYISNTPSLASTLIRTAVNTQAQDRESGAEHIVEALESWGVLRVLADSPETQLDVIQRSRWLAMVGPQRQQLRGHMEKVHGKAGYSFQGMTLGEPRDLLLLQKHALDIDYELYEYRKQARRENQQLSYKIYSLLFNDDQDIERISRQELSLLRQSNDIGQRSFAREAVVALDKMLDELVKNSYNIGENQLQYIESFASSLYQEEGINHPLRNSIKQIVADYRRLATREKEHQAAQGITYRDAAQKLIDEQMTIS